MTPETASAAARLTIILITYNSREVVGKALASIPIGIRTMVVDNSSHDGTPEYIQQNYPHIEVIVNPKNLGFGPANNIALTRVSSEFSLLMNPDACFSDPSTLEALIAAAERYPEAAILAPAIHLEDGTPLLNLPAPLQLRRTFNNRHPLNAQDVAGEVCAFSLSGALMLLRMSAFSDAPYFFDPNIFMYFEDDDICMSVRRRGHTAMLIPSISVMHMVGQSSPTSLEVEALKIRHKTFSQIYILNKHGFTEQARRRAFKTVLKGIIFALLYRLIFNRKKAMTASNRMLGAFQYMKQRYTGTS